MPIEYKSNQAILRDVVSVEEAESLLEWLQGKSAARLNLSACTHLHSANLQVLMAARKRVAAWPEDANLRVWLECALRTD